MPQTFETEASRGDVSLTVREPSDSQVTDGCRTGEAERQRKFQNKEVRWSFAQPHLPPTQLLSDCRYSMRQVF